MASILTVANVHFDKTGITRLEHTGSDNVIRCQANAVKIAVGATTSRPTVNEVGLIRYDTDFNTYQFYWQTGWANVAKTTDVTSADQGQNNYLLSVISGANATIGSTINTYWQTTMASANSAVGTGANTYLQRTLLANSTVTLQGSLTTTGNVKSSSDVSDTKGDVRTIPVNSKSSGYTLLVTDVGKFISITTGGITLPANVFKAGDAISIYNNSGSSQSIITTDVTCYLGGTATSTSPRTLAQRGIATVLCVGSNEFVITGSGLS